MKTNRSEIIEKFQRYFVGPTTDISGVLSGGTPHLFSTGVFVCSVVIVGNTVDRLMHIQCLCSDRNQKFSMIQPCCGPPRWLSTTCYVPWDLYLYQLSDWIIIAIYSFRYIYSLSGVSHWFGGIVQLPWYNDSFEFISDALICRKSIRGSIWYWWEVLIDHPNCTEGV